MNNSHVILLAVAVLQCLCNGPVSSGYTDPSTDPRDGPPAGNSNTECTLPAEARAEDITNPDQVIGDGTPESCTAEGFIEAVARGGVITFNCGPAPATIKLDRSAKVFNDADSQVVIDGGGKITLSGTGRTRILYMNTCDKNQTWTTPHCQDQDHPQLTMQNLTFIDGNSKSETEYPGGGAIWARGGRLKIVNCRFFNNVCADIGPDVGGGAVRALSQYNDLPVYVVNSTFGGGDSLGNAGSNGGALSSIGVSWSIYNSYFAYNRAVGNGGNPAQAGTPGGGSGGAIYNDGNTMTLSVCGSRFEYNEVHAYGAAVFFVSNDHTGNIELSHTIIRDNIGGSWHILPGISMHSDTRIDTMNCIIK